MLLEPAGDLWPLSACRRKGLPARHLDLVALPGLDDGRSRDPLPVHFPGLQIDEHNQDREGVAQPKPPAARDDEQVRICPSATFAGQFSPPILLSQILPIECLP